MSVIRAIIWLCTSRPRLTWLFTYHVLAFSTEKTLESAAYPWPRSGTGVTAADVPPTAPAPNAEGSVPAATADRWTSQRTPTSSGFTSETAQSRAGEEMCSRCGSLAATTGQGSWRLVGQRCLTSCPHQVSSVSTTRDAPRSRAPPSTGHAYFHSTGRDVSTLGKSSSSNGNPRS